MSVQEDSWNFAPEFTSKGWANVKGSGTGRRNKAGYRGARSGTRTAQHGGTAATLYVFMVSQRLMQLVLERAMRSDVVEKFRPIVDHIDKDVRWFSRGGFMSKVYPVSVSE